MSDKTPTSARRRASELTYQAAKLAGGTVPLDQEPHLLDFDHWYLIKNRFPYDMIFAEHDMLIPRSGAANREELTIAEGLELSQILNDLESSYDLYFENYSHRRSVGSLYHLHFARYYHKRELMQL